VIDVARIDYWAASGTGLFHRASVSAKLIFVALVVAAAVLSRTAPALACGYGILLIVASAARLPVARIAVLSFYAALFAALYAVSLREAGLPVYGLVLLKAITPAMAVLMLIVSTPYPRLFSLLSSFLPELLSAGLFMTYRTFFILMDMMGSFTVALRLRGGIGKGRIVKTIANIPRGIAMLLVAAVERSSRLYAVMAVRGYSGSMAEKERATLSLHDWLPLGTGIAVLLFVILDRSR
jgi:energy-coupling factor transporter transmembrane protein EcfT